MPIRCKEGRRAFLAGKIECAKVPWLEKARLGASQYGWWTVKTRIVPGEKRHCSVFPRDHVLLYNKQSFKRP